jgi:hypothetical protein
VLTSDATFYLTSVIVLLVLSLQLTHFWWKNSRDRTITWWMAASWVFVMADSLFAAGPWTTPFWSRVVPATLITVAHGFLLLGAQRAGGLRLRFRLVVAAAAVHFALLADFLYWATGHNDLRAASNRVFWAGFCFACFLCLRKASRHYWASLNSPAAIFLLQSVFLTLRLLAAFYLEIRGLEQRRPALIFLDQVDVVLFNGALFISLLLAFLRITQEAITSAQVEMQTLSGLLPVCAWCKKVRDDDGYWREIADYFNRRGKITHGVCRSCAAEMGVEFPGPSP